VCISWTIKCKNQGYFSYRPINFFIISRSFLHRMTKNPNTHFVFRNFFKNRVINEIMWKKFVERGKPQMTIRRMRI